MVISLVKTVRYYQDWLKEVRSGMLKRSRLFNYHRLGISLLVIILSAVLSALIVLPGCGLTAAPVVGRPAPDFTLADLDGNTIRLRDFRGKTVFLNFWATWCAPCRSEMPEMEEFYQEYKDDDVVVIGIDIREAKSDVIEFVQENGYNWTIVIDGTGEVTEDYMVSAIPTSFFIDGKGIIRSAKIGPMSKSTMESRLAIAME